MRLAGENAVYAAVLLLASPLYCAIIAHAAAETALACAGFRAELLYIAPILAPPALLAYLPVPREVPASAYRLLTLLSGLLYATLFYALAGAGLECPWPLHGFAGTAVAVWAVAVALLFALHAVFAVPVGYIALFAALEFQAFYLIHALRLGYISLFS